ncbi:hypothetical protein XA68_10921 [Ophiocordyceps unilateralis]|uniref:Protein BZZ1 n=1 Tax=Ophiocordyceps unilateralis TaxID=268505 RepID=A0A2A9PI02_OPHUN|nr:hypothetical protein XA68_10921 [Ophiocordyceps unilateralis]
MAEVETAPSFGSRLKDGFRPANVWLGHNIAWLDEVQQFYRDRAVIEKEYSAKLTALARKYYEKKNKRSPLLSVGDSPAMTPGSVENASLTAWSAQLSTLESRAAENDRFANNLVSNVAEPLKQMGARFDELRKRHAEHADKLAAERDASAAELRKVKAKYDASCQEVEAKRKKSESHSDKAKAQSAYQQQILEMNDAKNTYLIAINVSNRQKHSYYHEYVPELMDSLQDLSEFRALKLNEMWTVAVRLEDDALLQARVLMESLEREIPRNEPHLDSVMYMRHNVGSSHEMPDREFEPNPVWHDDDAMITDATAKVYLRNILTKSKAQLSDLRREVDKKRREVDGAKRLKQRVRDGTDKTKDEAEVVRALFALQEELHAVDRRRLTAEVEVSTITAAVGDVTLGAKNHNFKSQTFKIPTNCDLCGERIWGLSAKGFDCRDCGYTCHNKCEMKVPADCPGEQTKEERKKLKTERQEAANRLLAPDPRPAHVAESSSSSSALARSDTMNSLSSLSARRPAGPRTPTTDDGHEGSFSSATTRPSSTAVTTPTTANTVSSGIKSPTSGARKRVMAPPPAAYVSEGGANGVAAREEERRRGKMIYAFEASGDGELSVPEGREVTQLEPDDGSGWVKVRVGYKEGIVPLTYVDFSSTFPPSSSSSSPPLPAPARPSSTYSNSTTSSTTTTSAKKKGPAVAPKRGAKKLRYVEALYGYAAQSSAEHSMHEGERFVLVKDDPGDGWVEVEKAGVTATVPASYVRVV